jgi:hypothetical protein
MKRLLALVVCWILTGCEYTAPLVKTPGLEIDPSITGFWQRAKEDGQKESLLVLPLNKREYLVSFPAGSENSMYARACLCRTADMTLVQMEWIGTAKGDLPSDNRVFQYATYTVSSNSITIRMLNADVVKKDVTTTRALSRSIADNKGKPDLFRNEMVFKKIRN